MLSVPVWCFPLTRFRISNHCLAIEKGRHSKPKTPIEKRSCLVCDTQEIEDEEHFLCNCQFFNNLRTTFITNCERLGFYGLEQDFNVTTILNVRELSFYVCKLLNKMFAARQIKMSST